MEPTQRSEFAKLLASCAEIAEEFPDGIVFIGGVAVYLHAINNIATANLAETTHDADFYISLVDMADLRDLEEVVPNRRLSKHQMIKHGFEFDIYTERQSSLVVPYDVIAAHAVRFGSVRVASLEHLLVLKLEAFADRKGSAKGEKDARDLLRICAVASASPGGFQAEWALPFLSDVHLTLLQQVAKSPQAVALAGGNAQQAKAIRFTAQEAADRLRDAQQNGPSPFV